LTVFLSKPFVLLVILVFFGLGELSVMFSF
jgi:hypothetical protein